MSDAIAQAQTPSSNSTCCTKSVLHRRKSTCTEPLSDLMKMQASGMAHATAIAASCFVPTPTQEFEGVRPSIFAAHFKRYPLWETKKAPSFGWPRASTSAWSAGQRSPWAWAVNSAKASAKRSSLICTLLSRLLM